MLYRALLAIALLWGTTGCIFNPDDSRFFNEEGSTTGEQNTSAAADAATDITQPSDTLTADSEAQVADTLPDTPPPQDTAPPPEDTATPDTAPPPEDTSSPEDSSPPRDTAPPPEDAHPPRDTAPPPEDTRPPRDTPCTTATAYRDNDDDGQGDPAQTTTWCVEEGSPPEGYSALPLDCDDNDPAIIAGARRCSDDGATIQICAEARFRDIATCGFEQSCFATPDGAACGCDPDVRRCEDWLVRLCAPDRSGFVGYDCRPDQCINTNNGATCPECDVIFLFRDRDGDGDGNLFEHTMACAAARVPMGYATTGTDCRDNDTAVSDGDLFCEGSIVRRCEAGRAATVQRCDGLCAVVGPGLATCP